MIFAIFFIIFMFTFIGFLDKSIKVFNFIKVLQNTQMN